MSDVTTLEPSERPRSRIVAAAALYFVLVFAVGMALGPIRVIWLEPVLGRTLAILCETPFLLAAMMFAAERASGGPNLAAGGCSL